jgi:hypothetical protein
MDDIARNFEEDTVYTAVVGQACRERELRLPDAHHAYADYLDIVRALHQENMSIDAEGFECPNAMRALSIA